MIYKKIFKFFVNDSELYGRHILKKFIRKNNINTCLDIGCGWGFDLEIVKECHVHCNLNAIDFVEYNKNKNEIREINFKKVNIESEKFPFSDNSFDLIIANQVLEHVKEIFWINHEIFRLLKPGGFLYIGVPNIVSWHNRILSLFGRHPTQWKIECAHVRPFSIDGLCEFYKKIGVNHKVKLIKGSNFYPFPPKLSKIFSFLLPSFCSSIFVVIERGENYNDEFIKWPKKNKLESNFKVS